jgi:pimeloyl-ACP methyl ester carboxylesterase
MEASRTIVILLHGIGRTGASMRPLGRALEQSGYQALAISYPWRDHNIDGLAQWVDARLAWHGVWQHGAPIHFVTHSMGGLVARRLIERRADGFGRLVMLGPPNGGSEVADTLHRSKPYRWFYGPAGQELTTAAARMDPVSGYETGVIAGNRGWPYPLGNLMIRGPHDGRVAVARTRLPGMTDHVVLKVTHSFMPTNPSVQHQVMHFLANGRFDH